MDTDELALLADADQRAAAYLREVSSRRVFPDRQALDALGAFDEPLPDHGQPAADGLALLDRFGSPATTASNGPNYYGFVIGACLPAAAAAERLMLAWDQAASTYDGSPIAATLERIAGSWVVAALGLPAGSAVGFGTSASACTLSCVVAARRRLLARQGWDFDADGLHGAPPIRVVISELAHITVIKALRVLGFGLQHLLRAPVNQYGQVDPAQLPELDASTILCLQAGEVNTGECDSFAEIIPRAAAAGAWVHIDGAFGLWARASSDPSCVAGVEQADSWTTDGHKWLNTPYDGAMAICRDPQALAEAMSSDAAYSMASTDAQKNLTLEFSRRARGIPVWAALRNLGRDGLRELIDRHRQLAVYIADGLRQADIRVLNRVVLNQVLIAGRDDAETVALCRAVQASGKAWFGTTLWQGRPAGRISVSSWRTGQPEAAALVELLHQVVAQLRA